MDSSAREKSIAEWKTCNLKGSVVMEAWTRNKTAAAFVNKVIIYALRVATWSEKDSLTVIKKGEYMTLSQAKEALDAALDEQNDKEKLMYESSDWELYSSCDIVQWDSIQDAQVKATVLLKLASRIQNKIVSLDATDRKRVSSCVDMPLSINTTSTPDCFQLVLEITQACIIWGNAAGVLHEQRCWFQAMYFLASLVLGRSIPQSHVQKLVDNPHFSRPIVNQFFCSAKELGVSDNSLVKGFAEKLGQALGGKQLE
jgi:hypothetical protein